ncbi:MAG: hypothetical protein WD847_13715 [Pirellulales bacterium]
MAQLVRWESRRHDDRVATNADQSEIAAVRYGSCNLEAGTFDDRVAESLDDYEVSDPQPVPDWASRDAALDNATSDIGIEIRRRQQILGGGYPFHLTGNILQYRPSSTLVYEFCLAVSQSPSLNQGDYARLPVAFERLVRDVLVCFLGPGTNGVRTGWPPDGHEIRPPRFKDVSRQLHSATGATGEWWWSPDNNLPHDPDSRHVKDEGLDVVVWKGIADGRPGKLFVLGQCACGNDYQTKFYDISADFAKLKKWMKPLSFATPLRVFSTPRHIPNDAFFAEVNREAGLTFDRARIALLAVEAADYVTNQAREPYADLISIAISGFRVG